MELSEWLSQHGCTQVAMEVTGVDCEDLAPITFSAAPGAAKLNAFSDGCATSATPPKSLLFPRLPEGESF